MSEKREFCPLMTRITLMGLMGGVTRSLSRPPPAGKNNCL